MKKLMIVLCAVAITAIMGCGKDGETGPAGADGTAGANGTNGTNGVDGNANVKLFMFGPTTFTSADDDETYNFPSSVTSNMLDSSMVVYYSKINTTTWIPVPSVVGFAPFYLTRVTTNSSARTFRIQLADEDNTPFSGSASTFLSVKAIVVPSSDYSGSRYAGVDFNNYEATMKYFGLPLN